MRRFFFTILLIAFVFFGGWLLYNRNRIQSVADIGRLIQASVPAFGSPSGFADRASGGQPARNPQTIRLASFKLNAESGAAEHPAATQLMTEICKQFDLIALQDVSASGQPWLAGLAGSLNQATGGDFRFVTGGQRDGRQFAFLFDSRKLDADHLNTYTVNDPENLLTREPLVAWFRAKNAPPDSAFTFTVANIQLDSERPDRELRCLHDLFRAIRNDGRGEDDVIIAGDFNCGDRGLGLVQEKSSLTRVVSNQATDILQQAQYDNLVFSELATVEFTGRADVFNFLKFYNLSINDASGISKHMPVWAEFSVFEGGAVTGGVDHVANDPGDLRRSR